MSITEKKYKLMKMIVSTYYLELIFILLNILYQQKLMKKVILIETLILEKRDKKHQKKELNCKVIRINTSKENYDAEYEASRIQTFICKFQGKEKENEIKKLEDEINKLKLQLTIQNVQNDDADNKNKNNDNHNNHNDDNYKK